MKQLVIPVALLFLSGCELMDASVRTMQAMERWEPSTHSSPQVHPDNRQDVVVNPNAALVRAAWGKGDCMPTKGGRKEQRDYIEIDAGPIKINAICVIGSFLAKRSGISNFDFVAEAGHTYEMEAIEKDCMSLFDVTSKQTLISCEPYRRVE